MVSPVIASLPSYTLDTLPVFTVKPSALTVLLPV